MAYLSLAWFMVLLSLSSAERTCRYLPGDKGWPNQNTWSQLNTTVEGRLIATVPQARVCHTDTHTDAPGQFDDRRCKLLQLQWDFPQTFEPNSGEIMNPFYQNQSCDPFTPKTTPCELGNYVSYSINVTSPEDIIAGIQFSKNKNVRLVIKNTGHDFLGKSTAKGGLGLWMHNIKTKEFIKKYISEEYVGPAVKLGAGITGYEALDAVHSLGYVLVSGDCPTVGMTGGYTQGGGHSLLNGAFGMAADQVLEWEVITAAGEHITTTPTKNSDLYWAISGGGPGTFAVVLSMTVKIYPDGPVGTAAMNIDISSVLNTTYLEAMNAWWTSLPEIVDTGATAVWLTSPTGFTFESFTAWNKTASQVCDMLSPFISRLNTLNVSYTFSASETASYYEHFNQTMGPLPYGPWPASMLFNSKFIPRAALSDADTVSSLTSTMNNLVTNQSIGSWNFGCTAINVKNISHPENAVAPYWRDSIAMCNTVSLWDWTIPRSEMLARKAYLADIIVPAFEKVLPNSGAYLNEADPYVYPKGSMEWKEVFYGENYGRLRGIKKKWDEEGVFYAYTAVGSDDWIVDDWGRLCRV